MNKLLTLFFVILTLLGTAQIEQIPDEWELKKGDLNGALLIIRKNIGYQKIKNELEDYKFRTGIAFQFKNPSQSGMPSTDEMNQLNELENRITQIYEKSNKALITICLTTNGFREYVIYSKSKDWTEKCFKKLQKQNYGYVLTTYTEVDPEWIKYNEF